MAYVLVLLYGILFSLLNKFSNKYILILGLLIFLLLILFVLKRKDKLELVGINKYFLSSSKDIFNYLPILLVVLVNLVFNKSIFLNKVYLDSLLLILITVIFEEIFFRGYLLKITHFKVKGAFISSALFSILHIVSVYDNGSIFFIICSLIFAFVLGLSFSFYYLRDKNIYILILFHFLINLSSLTMNDMSLIGIVLSLISSIIILVCSYMYFKRLHKKGE